MAEAINASVLSNVISDGDGAFTPPPAPCGNPECGYVELDCVHVSDCQAAPQLIEDQPDQGITHKYGE